MLIDERINDDMARLRQLARTERNATQKDRLLEEAIGRSRGFVQRWAYAYRDGGIEALEPKPRGGSKPKSCPRRCTIACVPGSMPVRPTPTASAGHAGHTRLQVTPGHAGHTRLRDSAVLWNLLVSRIPTNFDGYARPRWPLHVVNSSIRASRASTTA